MLLVISGSCWWWSIILITPKGCRKIRLAVFWTPQVLAMGDKSTAPGPIFWHFAYPTWISRAFSARVSLDKFTAILDPLTSAVLAALGTYPGQGAGLSSAESQRKASFFWMPQKHWKTLESGQEFSINWFRRKMQVWSPPDPRDYSHTVVATK